MSVYPDRDKLFSDASDRIGESLPDAGLDVLLHHFLSVLSATELQIARKMRDEITSGFGGRYCSKHTCSLMAELINGYLGSTK
jgi:hypothetical protein